MTVAVDDLSQSDFTSLLSVLEKTAAWTLDGDFNTRARALSDAVTPGTAGELRYIHRDTPGTLYLRFPDYGTPPGAMELHLEQPFDEQGLRSESRLGWHLQTAYETIAAAHDTAYLVPEATAYTVVALRVPIDYELATFARAIEAVDEVSATVADLHHTLVTFLHC